MKPIFKAAGLVGSLVLFAYIGATIDYTYRAHKARQESTSLAMSQLASDLFVIDAIRANRSNDALEVLLASSKRGLYEIAMSGDEAAKLSKGAFPCALVKKARLLQKERVMDLSEEDELEGKILSYMNNNCPGLPEKPNMAELGSWENSAPRP